MLFAGVDLHKQTITIVVVNAARKVITRRRFANTQSALIVEFLNSLGKFQLVVEATAGYEWFVQLVEPLAQSVVLAHPGKLRIIAESTRKSDKLDARVLAEMLALDQIPRAHRPTPRQRQHRTLVRHRQYLTKRQTSVRNKIRHILANYNLDRSDLFTEVGQEYLAGLSLSPIDRFAVDQLVREWELFHQQLGEVERAIREFGRQGPEQEREDRERLQSIPGVGFVTTEVILAEFADLRRFSSGKKAAAYAGLAPGQRESAGRRKSLHIEKTGSPLLRAILNQAAWQLVQRSDRWRRTFERLATGDEHRAGIGRKKAITAIARRLVCLAHSLLKNRCDYFEPESTRPPKKRKPTQPAAQRAQPVGA